MFFRRKAPPLHPTEGVANETDLLKDMIRRLLAELKEHDRDYKHFTSPKLVSEANSLLGKTE
jgi:hypothetical protein